MRSLILLIAIAVTVHAADWPQWRGPLRNGIVPGIAALDTLDSHCAGLNVSREHRAPISPVALVLSRGFGSTNTALLVRV